MVRHVPTTPLASSDARKMMPFATSSVVMSLPMGFSTYTCSSIARRLSGSVSPSQKMGVSVAPGQTQLMRTP